MDGGTDAVLRAPAYGTGKPTRVGDPTDGDGSPLKEFDCNGIYLLSPSGELELLSAEQDRLLTRREHCRRSEL